jgi:fused signal recognition particle receptor
VNDNFDYIIIDTAGRLHTNGNLLEELKKIVRVSIKATPTGNVERLLVLDGSSGQNALTQANVFNETVGITSIAVTKLDGTAKGGIALQIASELKLPIKYAGFGETAQDLADFDPVAFVDAIFTR